MKSKVEILFLCLTITFLNSCHQEKWIIYIDELSQYIGNQIVEEYKLKYPNKQIEVYVYNTDFLLQSIKMGKKPHVFISFDTIYAQKLGLYFPKKKLIARDALVLAVADTLFHSWNDLLTKGKYIGIPMQNTALYSHVQKYLDYKKIPADYYLPIYPHDFKSMSLYLEKKMIACGIMLKSQADYYQLRGLHPYFHQSLLHYVVELNEDLD